MRGFIGVFAACLILTGCGVQRAADATKAQAQLVGMSQGEILTCMGPPDNKAAADNVEVWSYHTGNGRTTAVVGESGGFAYGSAHTRSCTVNIAMQAGRVSKVSYAGDTGGLLTKGEQCAYAVDNCLH